MKISEKFERGKPIAVSRQILRIMKLTIVIMIACLLQVGATTKAQITLKIRSESMQRVLENISKQSGYDFVYSTSDLKELKATNIDLNNVTIETALKACFANQPLQYEIADKTVMIKRKGDPTFLERLADRWAAIDVHGRVVDQEGKPLPGATVKVKGTGKSVSTNGKGEFHLDNVEEEVLLVVSFIGYVSKEVSARKEMGDIVMEVAIGELDEVAINKGYYSTSKELNTGSIGTLLATEIGNQPVSNPLMTLEGRIPGLFISEQTGVPGVSPIVSLRGRNSINNGIEPLYIIDGIPYDSKSLSQLTNAGGTRSLSPFMNIRPGDIERIDVLKDADATAIYGSRGANGVILITTKRGTVGKTTVNVDAYRGAAVVASKLKLMNTDQYVEMRNEANKNDNVTPLQNEYDINGTWDKNRYTDWQDVLIGSTAESTNLNASVSGGTQLTQVLFSLGYRKEGTIFPGDFKNEIGSGNFNVNHTSDNHKFKLNFGTNYSVVLSKLPITNFGDFIFLPPNAPAIYRSDGDINWENNTFKNPMALLKQISNATTKNSISNLSIGYDLFKDLNVSVRLGYNNIAADEQNIIPYSSYMPLPGDNQAAMRNKLVGFNQTSSYILEPQINYITSFAEHNFEALLGTTFNESNNANFLQTTSGYGNDFQIRNSLSATLTRNSEFNTQYKYNAIYFRFGYNYAEKYIVNLTGRRDGSSRFGPGKQFGNFGAIGIAWNFAKENFIANNFPFMTVGKLRTSIGTTGNDQFTDYEFISAYSTGAQYFGISNLNPLRLTNPNYRWERINKLEVGLELGFLNNHILVNTSYYRNYTSNQLVGVPLPSTTGFTIVRANLPATIQNNGFELEIQANRILKGELSWNASFNLTIPKNRLISYPNIEQSSNNSFYAVGYPLSLAFVYRYSGIDTNTGQYTFVDLDKSGSITPADRYPRFIGQHFFGGLSNSLKFKNFNLDVFFQYVNQTRFKFQSNRTVGAFTFDNQSNQPVDVLDRWQSVGDNAVFQKFVSVRNATGAFTASDRFLNSDAMLVNGSFIRLKNAVFSYALPAKWIKQIKVSNAKIFMQGQNLLTITGFKGSDPENASSGGNKPQVAPLRTITAGFQLTL